MKRILFAVICLLFINTTIAQNVMISSNNSPNEPSIMLDPNNTNNIIAASNIDNYYLSTDAGLTWSEHNLSSTNGVWGDPVIAVDTQSNFYFFHLSNPNFGNWIDRIVCQKTTDNGLIWNDGSYAGLNGTKAQDKQWCSIDRANNIIYLTWTQFDSYGSTNSNDKSIILFSKSTDGGITWSVPKKINQVDGDCVDSGNTVEGAVPAVGPNGEVYVAWAGPAGIVFDKSTDGGETWLNNDIFVNEMPGGWDFAIPGINRSNGLPITVCDTSSGPNRGTIYVNWADQRNGTTDTDIWLAKSTDGGLTWSSEIRVNNDLPGKQQFLTWMAIDQTNGYLYFIYYDRRNYSDNSTDVYVALSTDGGITFHNKKISETPFIPISSVFFGDYNNITVYNGVIRPIWTRLSQGNLSVWTDITTNEFLLTSNIEETPKNNINSAENYPNPAIETSYVSFKLHKPAKVTLSICNVEGKEICIIMNNEQQSFGKHIIPIDLKKYNLTEGVYYYKLFIDNKQTTMKMLVKE